MFMEAIEVDEMV